MDNKEAIAELKDVYAHAFNYTDRRTAKAFALAIDALDKQIPKKPTRVSASEGCYLCPTCGSKRISNMAYDKFCRDCGQAIDWTEEGADR